MDAFRFRHRHAVALPFLVVALVVLAGGALNSIDVRGRVVDDLTDQPVKDTRIQHGVRAATSDANGEFSIPAVPRTSKFAVDAMGYLRQQVATTNAGEIRLKALSVTIYAYDETKTPDDRVKDPQARDPQSSKTIATGNQSGQIIIAPHPGRDAKVMVCGPGFEPRTVTVAGVLMQVGLKPGGAGCPPLPSPSPAPGATPSPTAPAPPPTSSP